MSGSRTLFTVVALVALLVMTLAAPVAAAKTKLAIVNGIPGKKVDVCVNGKEITSGLRYGRYRLKTTRTAKAKIKFFQRDRRTCRGKLIAGKVVDLADATVVLTKLAPKVVVFDNSHLAQPIVPTSILISGRHAGDVAADLREGIAELWPLIPSAAFTKGGHYDANYSIGGGDRFFWSLTAHRAGATKLLAQFGRLLQGLRRWEVILVGRSARNARFVFIDRPANPV